MGICPMQWQRQRLPRSSVYTACATANGSFNRLVQQRAMASMRASIGCRARSPLGNESAIKSLKNVFFCKQVIAFLFLPTMRRPAVDEPVQGRPQILLFLTICFGQTIVF